VTLPTQSLPAAEPDNSQPESRFSSPASFAIVVAVGALVVILCVLGVSFTGLFNVATSGSPATDSAPAPANLPARVPVSTFPDGQWLVGVDIQAGTYRAEVPIGSPGCTWERTASTDGTVASILESGTANEGEQLVVNVRTTDKVFLSAGCGSWTRVAD
jgi:hypothetical protein